ncbi:type III pantothenate kinase [Thiohalorhabdus methylotrophus]|uniref:Type III pantothenate kinase n=1 Tax=Thiohalorhabdus methylotrophus TaxID=3242694 RepID=A0ABV4TSM5_9GAMM
MILAVDVGNTVTRVAVFGREGMEWCGRVPTDCTGLPGSLGRLLQEAPGLEEVQVAGVCSVVPKVDPDLRTLIREMGLQVLEIRPGLSADIRVGYTMPEELGVDRYANAAAAYHRYGGPVAVVDVGTALTMEIVDERGVLWGGPIFPGPEVALRGLGEHAARLQGRLPDAAGPMLASSTAEGISAGVAHGYPALVEGLISRARDAVSVPLPVILTGGGGSRLQGQVAGIAERIPHLTLEGIALLAGNRSPAP